MSPLPGETSITALNGATTAEITGTVSFGADESDMVVSTLLVAYTIFDTIMLRLNLAIENHPTLGNCDDRNEILVPTTHKYKYKTFVDLLNPIGVFSFDEFETLIPNCLIKKYTVIPTASTAAYITYPACSQIECLTKIKFDRTVAR